MEKKPVKLFKKAIKKDIRMAKKGSKRLSKQLFGKKGLMISHTFDDTITVFSGGNESKPLYSVNRSGSCKFSVLKMILIAVGVILGAVLLGLAIKAIVDRVKSDSKDEFDDYDLEYTDADELPF